MLQLKKLRLERRLDLLKSTHKLELRLESALHPRFIVSRGVVSGGADWEEDIWGWDTSDSSIIGQKSFMEVAKQRPTVTEVSLNPWPLKPVGLGEEGSLATQLNLRGEPRLPQLEA